MRRDGRELGPLLKPQVPMPQTAHLQIQRYSASSMLSRNLASSILIYPITFLTKPFQIYARVAFSEKAGELFVLMKKFFDLCVSEEQKYSLTYNESFG